MKKNKQNFYKRFKVWLSKITEPNGIEDRIHAKREDIILLRNLVADKISIEDTEISKQQLISAELRRSLSLRPHHADDARSLKKHLRKIDEHIELRKFFRQDLEFSERDLLKWLVGLQDRLRFVDAKISIDDLEEIFSTIDFRLREIRILISSTHLNFIR